MDIQANQSWRLLGAVVAAVLFAMQTVAVAEVADSSTNGFTVKITTQVQATPENVYSRIIRVGDWWSSDHTYSGDAHNLSLEERPGGCFCEKLANGGGVRHMEVVLLIPGKLLRMSGGLGPLQGMATAGSMTFSLAPADSSTTLEVTYAVVGYSAQGLSSIAVPVDHVLSEQITRLKNYIEKGDPGTKGDGAKPH